MQGSARKEKAHLELTLARGVKGNKKSLYPYISSKRLNKENGGPLLNGARDLATAETGKTGALIAFFASVFTKKVFQASMLREGVEGGEQLSVDEDQVRVCLKRTSRIWDPPGCTQGCRGRWLLCLQGCPLSCLKGCGDQGRPPATGGRQTL